MRFERRRNEATLPEYRENIEGAMFTPMPAEFLEQRKTVRGNPEATKRFIMALEGLIPPGESFNPNLQPSHSRIDSTATAGA